MKFATRKEQRKVNEVVSAVLLPLIPHLKEDEAGAVQTAIAILQKVEVEGESKDNNNDIQLDNIVNEIKKYVEEALKIIHNCEYINTYYLERDIKIFLENY